MLARPEQLLEVHKLYEVSGYCSEGLSLWSRLQALGFF